MNLKSLAFACLLGLLMWVGIIGLLDQLFVIDWAEAGRLTVMLVLGFVLGAVGSWFLMTITIVGDALDPMNNDDEKRRSAA